LSTADSSAREEIKN
jgi:hypothetical protein